MAPKTLCLRLIPTIVVLTNAFSVSTLCFPAIARENNAQAPANFAKPSAAFETSAVDTAGLAALTREALLVPGRDLSYPNFVRMPASTENIGSDYLPVVRSAARGRTIRFSRMPIPVYIDASAQPELMSACLSALYMWEFRTNGQIRFVHVPSPGAARVLIYLKHHGFQLGGTPQGAVTHLDWQLKRGSNARAFNGNGTGGGTEGDQLQYFVPPQVIDINLDVASDRELSVRPLLMKNITAHELGHALGLLGHSTVKSDLLYKDTDEYSRLSERDLNTLYRLYQQKVDIPL